MATARPPWLKRARRRRSTRRHPPPAAGLLAPRRALRPTRRALAHAVRAEAVQLQPRVRSRRPRAAAGARPVRLLRPAVAASPVAWLSRQLSYYPVLCTSLCLFCSVGLCLLARVSVVLKVEEDAKSAGKINEVFKLCFLKFGRCWAGLHVLGIQLVKLWAWQREESSRAVFKTAPSTHFCPALHR